MKTRRIATDTEKIDLLKIENPSFLKNLNKKEMQVLAEDIRAFLIRHVSETGGHLSSNLGVVELTIAMHTVFSSPQDQLLFDVGHQCYTHKILTGRAKDFATLRAYGGLSGFIRKSESEHDIWESGHSSTSISAQCGFLMSEEIDADRRVVVLIGDASIANGVSFEALNYMGTLRDKNPIIIINDNKMSISRSVGAVSRYFSRLRSNRGYQKVNNFFARNTPRPIRSFFHSLKTSIKGLILNENIFEAWGYDYMGPYDGNDLSVCIKTLNAARHLNKPCVIHFVTKKGKGYAPAENDISGIYHGVEPFDAVSGKFLKKADGMKSFSKIAADHLERIMKKEPCFVITPAMIKGSELDELQKRYPKNIIDVGMAEEHATVMASAMAQKGKKVFLMLYSTFAQRAYDYLLNDIARTNTPLIIMIDRADLVPGDGETHQGIYDLSMFYAMPNMMILAPKDGSELCGLMDFAMLQHHPVVIRYGKGRTLAPVDSFERIEDVSWTVEKEGSDVTIITYGAGISYVRPLCDRSGYGIRLVNARFLRPLDERMLEEILSSGKPVLIYENCNLSGSLSTRIFEYTVRRSLNVKIRAMGLPSDAIVPSGDLASLRKHFHLTEEDIQNELDILLKGER